MELIGQRAILRPWRNADVASLVKYANNPNVARQLRDRFPHPYTTADARQFIQSIAQARPTTSFAIAVHGEAAGTEGGRLDMAAGERVEHGGLGAVGQPDDADLHGWFLHKRTPALACAGVG